MKIKFRFSYILALTVVVAICSIVYVSLHRPNDEKLTGVTTIKFQLQWFDQAQFAGFYVANAKGFYRDANLKVKIIPGGNNVNPIQRVDQGEADIGIATGDQLLIQRPNDPVKAIGTVFSKSIAGFMSKTQMNIATPNDLKGKRVAVFWGFDTDSVLSSLLFKNGINKSEVAISGAGSATLEAFIKGDIDVYPAYIINEPLSMEESGIHVNVLTPDKFGVHFYSDTIFTTEEFLKNNRDAVRRFLAASAKGWEYAERNPDEALDIMYREQTNPSPYGSSREHQKHMLQVALQNMKINPDDPYFKMDRARWQDMEQDLVEIGKLKSPGQVDKLCDFGLAPN